MNKNLRRVTITVTAQTLHHLKTKAGATGRRDLGQVVDELVREKRLATNNKKKPTAWDDVTIPAALRAAAEAHLAEINQRELLLRLKGVDPALLAQIIDKERK